MIGQRERTADSNLITGEDVVEGGDFVGEVGRIKVGQGAPSVSVRGRHES